MIAQSWTQPVGDWPGLGPWADDALVMAERAEDVVLARAADLPEGTWYRGHCFTADWHLQWRRMGNAVRAVALGPVPAVNDWPDPIAEQSLEEYDTEARSLTLWGKRQPGDAMWLELRIPNVMRPPTQHPAGHGTEQEDDLLRRVLHVVTYEGPGGDADVFHRYVGLGYVRSDDEETTYDVFDHPSTA